MFLAVFNTRRSEGNEHGSYEAANAEMVPSRQKKGRGIVMRIPSEGGGRLVIELSAEEAQELAQALANAL